ncbi:MAG: peptidoglycan-binding protein [Bacteroidetes bacterium]|nr:peptidoglycan-binding protein [Bacteroidota bacterium]
MGRVAARLEVLNAKTRQVEQSYEVQFNPTDLTLSKTAQLAEIAIPGLDSPVLQFIRGGAETLSVELFFDTTDSGMSGFLTTSVTDMTDKFYSLVKQNRDTHAPPIVRFSWGDSASSSADTSKAVSQAPSWFTGVVESVERKFLLFSPEGTPLRARLTLKMKEYKTVDQMVADLNSADHTKARVFKRRDRLDQLSQQEYDTPAEWRRIADENDLDDPRAIPAGTVLKVPPMRIDSATRGGE